MDTQGLWRLFFATGLPELYPLLRRQERRRGEEEPARTAFRPAQGQKGML